MTKARRSPGSLLFALIMLTQLDGGPVWIESKQILFIRARTGSCAEGTGAVVGIGQQYLCVKEKPGQIREKLHNLEGTK